MIKNVHHGETYGMKAVILAGGRGTRLYPYTAVLPKPLMPIGEKPILEIVVRQLRAAGFTDLTFSVGYLASLLEAYFGDGSAWGVTIGYSRETEPLGTAGPLTLVQGLSEPFLVMNGDLLTTLDYGDMIGYHRSKTAAVTVGLFSKQVKIDLGVIERTPDYQVTGYVEKPTMSYDVSMGVYVMEPSVLSHIPAGVRFDLPDLVKRLVASGERVVGYPFEGLWLDIGRHDDYTQAVEMFEQNRDLFLPKEVS